MSQLTLTSDPLGSATTGTFEFENPAFFMTGATAQRGAVLVDQFILLQSTNTLASQTAAQPLALLELKPRTGRTHQLRVQCARRQLPIVGDQTYGDFRKNREFAKVARTKRLFLHSLETQVRYSWAGREWSFGARAELPAEFAAAMAAAA